MSDHRARGLFCDGAAVRYGWAPFYVAGRQWLEHRTETIDVGNHQ